MSYNRLEGHTHCESFSAANLVLPSGVVSDANVTTPAIDQAKLQHKYQPAFGQPGASSAANEVRVVHVVRGATGTLLACRFSCTTAAVGAAVTEFRILKNGSTVLSANVSLGTTAAYTLLSGSFSSTALVVGDVLSIEVLNVSAGGGTLAKGVFGMIELEEDAV